MAISAPNNAAGEIVVAKKGRPPQSTNWAFTVWNYDDAVVEHLRNVSREIVKYMVVGYETAQDGRPHLQCHVTFKSPKRRKGAKAVVMAGDHECHIDPAKDTKASIKYCKKEGNFFEIGNSKGQGKRLDLETFKDAVIALEGKATLQDMRMQFSTVAARYPQFFRDFINDIANSQYPKLEGELRPWQAKLKVMLDAPPHSREMIFIVDEIGNTGKTWFSHWYEQHSEKRVQILMPGKSSDMAFSLINSPDVIIIDAPRAKVEHIQWDFLETIKNGYVYSPKYQPIFKRFKYPHLVIMMNEEPDQTKLSIDRYNFVRLSTEDCGNGNEMED